MKKVFTDEFLSWVSQAQQLLEEAGIPCFLKNEYTSSMGGEVPFFENWPELWIHQNEDFEQAQMILEPLRASRKAAGTEDDQQIDWLCPNCGESNAGNFALCWSCGFELQEV